MAIVEHERVPTFAERWLSRLRSGTTFASAHLVASLVALLLLLIVPLIVVIVGYVILLIIALATKTGLGGPLALPAGLLVTALSGVIACAVAIMTGLLADIVRRFTKLPSWSFPFFILLLRLPLTWLIVLALGHPLRVAATSGLLGAALATFLFCVYWVPLICAEKLVQLAWRLLHRIFRPRAKSA